MNEEGVGSTGSVDTGPPVPPHVTFWSPQKFSFLITKSGEENTISQRLGQNQMIKCSSKYFRNCKSII